jgi:ABC-type iron transport system FetAB permease component
MYFLPFIIYGFPENTFWNILLMIISNIIRLLFVNLILTSILLFFSFITTAIYEKLNKKTNNKEHIKIIKLWISISVSLSIVYILYLVFPKILSLIIYLIYF